MFIIMYYKCFLFSKLLFHLWKKYIGKKEGIFHFSYYSRERLKTGFVTTNGFWQLRVRGSGPCPLKLQIMPN